MGGVQTNENTDEKNKISTKKRSPLQLTTNQKLRIIMRHDVLSTIALGPTLCTGPTIDRLDCGFFFFDKTTCCQKNSKKIGGSAAGQTKRIEFHLFVFRL